jgi:hypothetical protein
MCGRAIIVGVSYVKKFIKLRVEIEKVSEYLTTLFRPQTDSCL